uniref:YokE n=1 Tax=Bacillus subtilis TaxID=1423 RepID=O30464_BACIU|nr:YokE [Bacillus subtilis subsp. subtilis str. 168]
MIYFNIENSSDIHEFLKIAVAKNDVDYPFLEWIKEKGIPRLKNIDFNKLPNDDRFLAMIEFDEFVLQNEMILKILKRFEGVLFQQLIA